MTGLKADDSVTSPARRVDAERNRARILDAARAALRESEDVSMHAIARQAGIGQGTLYRNFPNRESLILAVHRHGIQELVDAAPALAAARAPTDGLRRWLRDLARHSQGKCGLADALLSSTYRQLCSEDYQPIVGALEILLQACREAGEIRDDVDARDLLLLVGFLWYVEPDNEGRGRSDRLLDIVIDALRVDPEQRART